MQNPVLFTICALASMAPWGMIVKPLGVEAQVIGLAVQLIGLGVMWFKRKQIF